MPKYTVYVRSKVGPSCGVFDALDPKYVAWISKPCGAFAFGEFMCACLTLEDAQNIAQALNIVHDIRDTMKQVNSI